MEKINNAIIKLQRKFRKKVRLNNLLKRELDILHNIIIKIINNINYNYLIRRINNDELIKLNNKVNDLYNLNKKIRLEINFLNLSEIGFFKMNEKIIDYELEIKKFFKTISIDSINDILSFLISSSWEIIIDNKERDTLKFFNNIFVCSKINIESKYNYTNEIKGLNNGSLFFKKLKGTNMIDELSGAIIHIYIYNKVVKIEGFFRNDSLNIIKNNKRFNKKKKELNSAILIESIDKEFSKKYLKQISLKDFIVSSVNELSDQISIAYEKLHFYKDMSLTEILLTFNTSSFDRQRDMLTILILADAKSGNLASLMYDIILKKDSPIKAKQLYLSLDRSVQKLFDIAMNDFNDEIEKFKKISINDISFDKKIAMMDIGEDLKLKAMDKFKQIKGGGFLGGGSNDVKVETWLNGFIKIPFNNYKSNEIIEFLSNYPNKVLDLLINLKDRYNIKIIDDISINTVKKESNLNKVVKELGKLLIKKEISKFYLDQIGKVINNWNEYKLDRKIYIKEVRQILDNAVYGNNEGKEQIEKLIGQWINGKMNGAIIGLQGPPGVGKTTIAKKGLCKCLKDDGGGSRPFAFIPLGGSTNGSYLIGHSYTYIGSTWGRLVDILIEAKCMNPIIFIDELDKVSKTQHGMEIIGILTHLTDQTQNDEIYDKYFAGIKFDFSKCLFVFSYNDASLIDPILRDRITEVNIKPLTTRDKLEVVNDFLLPEILECVGLDNESIHFENKAIEYLIDSYTYEAGVRKLKEKILDIIRYINLQKIYGDIKKNKTIINKKLIDKILEKKAKIIYKKISKKPMIGYVNGLFATSAGVGGLTIIEVVKSFSDQKLGMILTGSQGDVMKESIQCAKTIAWNILPKSITNKIKKDWDDNGSWGLHIHTPDTATPKDGPSAGGAITLGIVSRLTGVPIKNTIATTGEIDLNGNIKKIGGLISKILGGYKAGIKTVIIPKENAHDLELIKKEGLMPKALKVILIDHVKDLIKKGLVANDLEFNYDNI
jgi:ATP-dependent Lon protease